MDESIFGDNVIFSYTDKDAVEDGILIPINGGRVNGFHINRVTRAVWEDYTSENDGQVDLSRLAQLLDLAGKNGKVEGEWTIFYDGGVKLWIIPNGDMMPDSTPTATLMYPSDY